MRERNDVLLGYLNNGLAAARASLGMLQGLIEKTSDVELLAMLTKRRYEIETHLQRLELIFAIRGREASALSIEPSAFLVRTAGYPQGEGSTVHEMMLMQLMDLLRIEQIQLATTLGLVELVRALNDAKAEELLMNSLDEAMISIEYFQSRIPANVGSALASLELRQMEIKKDILIGYARDAHIVESYIFNTMTAMAEVIVEPLSLQAFVEARSIAARKRDRLASALKRNDAEPAMPPEGTITLIHLPELGAAVTTPQERTLHSTMSALVFGHMMLGAYSCLINLARELNDGESTDELMENLSDTLRMIDMAYASLPGSIEMALLSLEMPGVA